MLSFGITNVCVTGVHVPREHEANFYLLGFNALGFGAENLLFGLISSNVLGCGILIGKRNALRRRIKCANCYNFILLDIFSLVKDLQYSLPCRFKFVYFNKHVFL